MFKFLLKPAPTRSSAFSEFIRNASAAEKKRVYAKVLERATARQKDVAARVAGAQPR